MISGVDKSVDIEEIIPIDFLRDKKVFIDKNSETTIDNANAIIDWSYKNNIKYIFIVTSDYHMPRSMLVLSKKGKALKNFFS